MRLVLALASHSYWPRESIESLPWSDFVTYLSIISRHV